MTIRRCCAPRSRTHGEALGDDGELLTITEGQLFDVIHYNQTHSGDVQFHRVRTRNPNPTETKEGLVLGSKRRGKEKA